MIDEGAGPPTDVADGSTPSAQAARYAQLFPRVYLAFHRRDDRAPLSGPARGVLLHLAETGPLTIGECAKHFRRAQSAVSEMVNQLEGHGLVARRRAEADARRTLVWLTDAGRERLADEQQVLSVALLANAFTRLDHADREALLRGTAALAALHRPEAPLHERNDIQ